MTLARRAMIASGGEAAPRVLVSFTLWSGGQVAHIYDATWTGGGTIYFCIEKTDSPYTCLVESTKTASPDTDIFFASGMTVGEDYELWWSPNNSTTPTGGTDPATLGWTTTEITWTQPAKGYEYEEDFIA